MTREDKVDEFYVAAGHDPEWVDKNILLHMNNFMEEVNELKEELTYFFYNNSTNPEKLDATSYRMGQKFNRQNLVKELADVQYTLSGLAIFLGVNLEEALDRVHANNMSKLIDGKLIKNSQGKVMKPAGYVKPDMQGL